jgi:hypothetical protein
MHSTNKAFDRYYQEKGHNLREIYMDTRREKEERKKSRNKL